MMHVLAVDDWRRCCRHHLVLLNGLLQVAIEVSVVALVLSMMVGTLLALNHMSRPAPVVAHRVYVNIFRSMPALVGARRSGTSSACRCAIGVEFGAFQAGVIALTLLYGAAFIAGALARRWKRYAKASAEAGSRIAACTPSASSPR